MSIAREVARVSGAVRCKRFGRGLGDIRLSSTSTGAQDFTLATMLADTDAYIRRTEKEFFEEPPSQEDNH